MKKSHFQWDKEKDPENQAKHNVSFSAAQYAFLDPRSVIVEDLNQGTEEEKLYCIGIMTVRFTYRNNVIRIMCGILEKREVDI